MTAFIPARSLLALTHTVPTLAAKKSLPPNPEWPKTRCHPWKQMPSRPVPYHQRALVCDNPFVLSELISRIDNFPTVTLLCACACATAHSINNNLRVVTKDVIAQNLKCVMRNGSWAYHVSSANSIAMIFIMKYTILGTFPHCYPEHSRQNVAGR